MSLIDPTSGDLDYQKLIHEDLTQIANNTTLFQRFLNEIYALVGTLKIKSSATLPLHHATHEDGGTDELSVNGLSGHLADLQDPVAHGSASHTGTIGSHTNLNDIGTNTHAQVDAFIISKAAASGLASLSAASLVVQNPANATATSTASKIPIADASGYLNTWILNQIVTCVNQQTANTHGGQATTGSWQTYPMNTLTYNDGTIASVATNYLTLPAGTYILRECYGVFSNTGKTSVRLQNITAGTTIQNGMAMQVTAVTQASHAHVPPVKFTLASSSALALQYYCDSSGGAWDLGLACNHVIAEQYGIISVEKL